MKARRSIEPRAARALKPLDLATLDRVIGGCRLAVVPNAQVTSVTSDRGLALAAADAWSSLGASLGASIPGAFTEAKLATDFMRADAGNAAVDLAAQAPLFLDDDDVKDLAKEIAAFDREEAKQPVLVCGTIATTSADVADDGELQ